MDIPAFCWYFCWCFEFGKTRSAPSKAKNFASIKEPKAIGALLRDIDAYTGNLVVRAALRMAPYVFVRPEAEWAEFNFEGAGWRIPAEKMKMRQVHLVPLAWQVLSILEDLRPYTGSGRFLFPSMRANSAPISDMTLLAGLRRLGYTKEQMTVHGFRCMASTRLNEAGFNRDWIERQPCGLADVHLEKLLLELAGSDAVTEHQI